MKNPEKIHPKLKKNPSQIEEKSIQNQWETACQILLNSVFNHFKTALTPIWASSGNVQKGERRRGILEILEASQK